MFVLERRLVQLFRTAVRLCYDGPARHLDTIPVLIRHSKSGILMHAGTADFTVMYSQPGQTGEGVLTFRASDLALFEGRGEDPVELAAVPDGKGVARWNEKGIPREVEFPTLDPEKVNPAPVLPKTFQPVSPDFLRAIHEAGRSAAQMSTKYVLNRIKLSGKNGEIISTDSRQLLIQGGFKFPFSDEVLIPRCGVFGQPVFQNMEGIGIGKTNDLLAIKCGHWIFAFRIDKEGRFPDAKAIVPKSSAASTRLRLDPADAEFFLSNLAKRITGAKTKVEYEITLDLNEGPCIRFRIDEKVMEMPLARSEVTGKPVRICVELQRFLRSLELRLLNFEFRDPEKPLVARDGERIYVAMPQPPASALAPVDNPVRLMPPIKAVAPVPAKAAQPTRETPRKRRPRRELAPVAPIAASAPVIVVPESTAMAQTSDQGMFDVFAEAEGLRTSVIKAAEHAGRILRFMREIYSSPHLKEVVRGGLWALTNKSP